MSIFITMLAFDNPEFVLTSKIRIMLGSIAAGCAGFIILSRQTAGINGIGILDRDNSGEK